MKEPLKQKVHKHYQNFELSSEQLDNLDQIQRERGERKRSQLLFKASFAAMAVSVLLLAFFLFRGATILTGEIAEEIAYNHNKQMKMEIKTSSIDQIQSFLSKVDFTIIQSEYLPVETLKIVGGRYCSIQGRLAVQIRIINLTTGKNQTLYQVPYPKDLENSKTRSTYVNGVQVKLWKEKGLLLGLAGG